jgi:hypothetical protein
MKPLTEDQVYDNMLLGQGYHTPHGAVIDRYWGNGGMMISRGKLNNSKKNLLQSHFVH